MEGAVASLRSGAFLGLWAIARGLERAATLLRYSATGLLRRADLRRAVERQWREWNGRYAAEPDKFAPLSWESEFYTRFLTLEDRILLVGCGTGRDLVVLLEHGYRVEGLDLVPDAIARARENLARRHLRATLSCGAIESIDLDGTFDAVVFSWFCYGYIPGSPTRIDVLRKVKAHLNPGGRVLVSYCLTHPRRTVPLKLARLVARLSRSDWRPEDEDILIVVDGALDGVKYERHFGPGELERNAAAAGLRVIHHERGVLGLCVLAV